MAQKPNRHRLEFDDVALEPRELPSGAGTVLVGAQQTAPEASAAGDLFHRNGIDGLTLHKAVVDQLTARFQVSTDSAHRIWAAFQVFHDAYFGVQRNPMRGAPAMPPTLPNLLRDLKFEVGLAVSTIELKNNQTRPWVVKAPKFSPRSFQAIIPYAVAQIDAMDQTLASLPPHGGGQSSSTGAEANAAMNRAYNAIYNALAEYTLHPNLFTSPSDFYINPAIMFNINLDENPALSAVGYFVRGPGGAVLPGAILHPHVPLG